MFPSRVLKDPGNPKMAISKLSTLCLKTGFVPKLLSRLGRDKSYADKASALASKLPLATQP